MPPASAAGPGPIQPKSPLGTPSGPGATPAASPGGGAGNEAAATAIVKATLAGMHKALGAFPVGSPKYKAVLSSIKALMPVFDAPDEKSLVPAAIQQMASAAKGGGPVMSAPAPGLAAAPPPESAAA